MLTDSSFRLNSSIIPKDYCIELWLNPQQDDFVGKVDITIDAKSQADEIILHAGTIQIKEVVIAQPRIQLSCVLKPEQELLIIKGLDKKSWKKIGSTYRVQLHISYTAKVGRNLRGLYSVHENQTTVLSTQCQATDARQIFPCFDEPIFKASIRWIIHAPKGLLVLTNGALLEQKTDSDNEKMATWFFQPTRPIPTYLAALVVGDFVSLGTQWYKNIPLNVYALKGKEAYTNYANQWTIKLLAFYEEYFAHQYPYGKYDQVAVPGFDAGAMENVGLVLFRQNALLVDDLKASFAEKRRVALTVAHELAHMWFGNLVTLKWWDELWLNEGFAEWIAHKTVHSIEPLLMVWDYFYESKEFAMKEDSKSSTHAIYTPVQTAGEALELFDIVTYEKGCAVLRMLENFIGEEEFKKIIQKYILKFADGHSTGEELFELLEKESIEQPISSLIKSWIRRPGYPLVKAELIDNSQNSSEDETSIILSQQQFFSRKSFSINDKPLDNDINLNRPDNVWKIPMVIRYEDVEGQKELKMNLDSMEKKIVLPSKSKIQWVHINKGQIGFYRTFYEKKSLKGLLSNFKKLSIAEQRGILSDQFAFLLSGHLSIVDFVSSLPTYFGSLEPWLLKDLSGYLSWSSVFFEDAYQDKSIATHFRYFLKGQFTQLIDLWINKKINLSHAEQSIFDQAIIVLLGQLVKEEQILEYARRLVGQEQKDPSSVDSNLVHGCLKLIATSGTKEDYERFLAIYKQRRENFSPPDEQDRYLMALPFFVTNHQTIQENLKLLSSGYIPQESLQTFLSIMLRKRESEQDALAFIENSWLVFSQQIGAMGVHRLVQSLGYIHPRNKNFISHFFGQHSLTGAQRALLSALNQLNDYQQLIDENQFAGQKLLELFHTKSRSS